MGYSINLYLAKSLCRNGGSNTPLLRRPIGLKTPRRKSQRRNGIFPKIDGTRLGLINS